MNMKKTVRLLAMLAGFVFLLLLGAGTAHAEDGILIDTEHFPDSVFRSYVKDSFDKNGDGVLSEAEINKVTKIDVSFKKIGSLDGISSFTNLSTLKCRGNSLITLDVSALQSLTVLDCSGNSKMTELNVDGCTSLTNLDLSGCKMQSLDVKSCTALTELHCSNNKFGELDLSGCAALKKLYCNGTHPYSLNVSGCTSLTYLNCLGNSLTELDLSTNTALKELNCSFCEKLTSLDVSGNKALRRLNCSNGNLKQLKIKGNKSVSDVDCSDNKLQKIDLDGCKSLTWLLCSGNPMTSIDLSGCAKLKVLNCGGLQISSLNLSGCENLVTLNCSSNQLKTLDVSECLNLAMLSCEGNLLTELDLSANKDLGILWIEGNPLDVIDLTGTELGKKLSKPSDYDCVESDEYDSAPMPGAVGFILKYSGYVDDWSDAVGTFDKTDAVIVFDTPSLTASAAASGMKLSWTKVSGASEYEIYRKTGNGGYKLIKTVSGTSYTDTGAPDGAVYRIRAKNGILYSAYQTSDGSGEGGSGGSSSPFTDVSESASYYSAVLWAVKNGIVSGTTATTFSPNADCTRYQLAVMLYRLAGKPPVSGVTLPFTDVPTAASYYNAVAWAYASGIISGTSKTTFSPNDTVKRYQVVQMLYKMVGKPAVSASNPFTDVPADASYVKAVLWAVQYRITSGTTATTFSPMASCKRYQMVVFLYKFNKVYNFKGI